MTFRLAAGSVALSVLVGSPVAAQYGGWFIPPGGQNEKSPLTAGPAIADKGRALYSSHCARCHGPEGKGNGPDSDHAADLTDELRDQINTDGVLFYKIWNGHAIQLRVGVEDMPAFKDTLTRNDVWLLVEHLKIVRTHPR